MRNLLCRKFLADSPVQYLRAVAAKSKTEIRLDVTLPKKSRRSSSSASLGTSNAMLVGDEAASIHDLGNNDLDVLSYIMITFSYTEGRRRSRMRLK